VIARFVNKKNKHQLYFLPVKLEISRTLKDIVFHHLTRKYNMKIFYDEAGDILKVQFKLGIPEARTGISLTDQITLFCDRTFQQALGLTALAYSKLLASPESPMNELLQAPSSIQQQVRRLLTRAPLKRLVHLNADKIRLEDVHISELALQ